MPFLSRKTVFCLIIFALISALFITGCAGSSSAEPEEQDRVENEFIFSFIFMSDTQADPEIGDYSAFGSLLALALSHESGPKLLILGGDNVNDGASAEEWDAFWKVADGRLDDVLTASVAGNHDSKPLLAEQFSYPDKAPATSSEGFFYVFSANNVLFLMLDSNIMGAGNESDAKWLADQLKNGSSSESNWQIAVCHHPFWPVVQAPKDLQRAGTMRTVFLPALESSGVDLILCGHNHVYSRTAPMLNGSEGEDGIIQIMTASGAKDSYVPADIEHIAITKDAPAYLIVEVGSELLTITAYDGAGEQIDRIVITKRAAES